MSIEYLREFVYLSKTLSFSKTAKAFYVTHSVISKHISSMETELGVKLFVRNSHCVRLTRCGEAFLAEVKPIVRAYDGAVSKAAAVGQLQA